MANIIFSGKDKIQDVEKARMDALITSNQHVTGGPCQSKKARKRNKSGKH